LSLGATEEWPNSETEARANALKACRKQIAQRKGDIVQKPNIPIGDLTIPFFQDYASKAVAAAKVSVQLSCEGNEGPRWSDNFNDHLDWCMALNGDQGPPNTETAARASALQSCREQIARRGEIVQKPNIPTGDLTKPVTPPPAVESVPKPSGGAGNIFKQMKP